MEVTIEGGYSDKDCFFCVAIKKEADDESASLI